MCHVLEHGSKQELPTQFKGFWGVWALEWTPAEWTLSALHTAQCSLLFSVHCTVPSEWTPPLWALGPSQCIGSIRINSESKSPRCCGNPSATWFGAECPAAIATVRPSGPTGTAAVVLGRDTVHVVVTASTSGSRNSRLASVG